jgi:hypothetical protein
MYSIRTDVENIFLQCKSNNQNKFLFLKQMLMFIDVSHIFLPWYRLLSHESNSSHKNNFTDCNKES